MKSLRRAALAGLFLTLMSFTPLGAVPTGLADPAVISLRHDARRVCHHYRWSSQSRCTSAKVLRQYDRRPALHYPSRYFADRPHYYYEQHNFYWRSYPWYAHHRWHRWPYSYGWPYRYSYSW